MKKKLLATVLTAVLALGTITGCGSQKAEDTSAADSNAATTDDTTASTQEAQTSNDGETRVVKLGLTGVSMKTSGILSKRNWQERVSTFNMYSSQISPFLMQHWMQEKLISTHSSIMHISIMIQRRMDMTLQRSVIHSSLQ